MKRLIFNLGRIALAGALALAAATGTRAAMPPLTDGEGTPTLAPVLEQVTPAVVNIAVLSRAPEEDNPMLQDPFFRRFFGLPERSQPQIAAGSGVIVDAKLGHVLTNHHVIKDAKQIVITLKDGRQIEARLLGSDAGTDIALLKVEAEKLTAIRFADSDRLRVGDYVLAIGNPFGIGQTVTSGIVSALGRTGLSMEGYEDFIQTDASINPGNSGGALVNLRGELVGINTAIIGPSGGNVGIGFAVPSNMVRAVTSQLARYGEVRRGRIGLTTQEITPELAAALGLTPNQGAVVVEVAQDSPAGKIGLKRGDVVVAVNGRGVRSSSDLRNQIGLLAVGEDVEFKVLRGGKELVLRTKVESLRTATALGNQIVAELQGATVGTLESRGKPNAVMIVEVEPDSLAWSHGLRPGDVIVAVNRRKVSSVRDLTAALKAPGRAVLSVVRGDYLFAIVLRR
ncbi:MAG TPA: DegQ family serine endoprotease [Burkholderiales bacterium]|nr:DegQ family serine endoprotease [Burkholderiales bacterium]